MKNIVLCGFMGCGKSTVGRRLAQILKMDFIDMDQWIEKRQGRRISAIFAQEMCIRDRPWVCRITGSVYIIDIIIIGQVVGEPHTQRFGCYAPVVVKTANRFLAEQGSGLQRCV